MFAGDRLVRVRLGVRLAAGVGCASVSRAPLWLALTNPIGVDSIFDAWKRMGGKASPPGALLLPECYRWPGDTPLVPKLAEQSETLMGIEVLRSAVLPRVAAVKIDPKFPWISDAGRERINARFLEQFGEVEVAFMLSGDALRAMRDALRTRLDEQMASTFYGGWDGTT